MLITLFAFLLISESIEAQNTIVKAYKHLLRTRKVNPNGKYIKGYWKGLEIIIDSAKVKYGIDLNKEDTLFIVTSHLDFVIGGFDEARIWNRKINLSSYNYENTETKRFYKKVQKDNNLDERGFPILDEIKYIKLLIETHKHDSINKQYIEKCNYFDGSLYELMWIVKRDKKFMIKSIGGRLCVGPPYQD